MAFFILKQQLDTLSVLLYLCINNFVMKTIFFFGFCLLFQFSFSQPFQNWEGYFSYNQIKDISESNSKIYAAAENAIFTKDFSSNNINTINTLNGLSGQTISALYHSDSYNKTIVGYEDGLLIVINESDGSMLNVVDILNKNLPANIKRVNHFMESAGVVYISCDFGIVQYKLATSEFGDTYFIGPSGQETKVYQTAIFNGSIYAVTQFFGIRKAELNNQNLNDFSQWQVFDSGFWTGLVVYNNQLIGLNNNTKVYKYNSTSFEEILSIGQPGLDIRATSNYLVITSKNKVFIYNSSLIQLIQIQNSQVTSIPVTFSSGSVINETIYIGTNENGIVSSPINSPTSFQFIMPGGPSRNNIFSINSSTSNLWAVYGGYDIFYNPYTFLPTGIGEFGISKFNPTEGWLNIPYSDVLNANALVSIAVNPEDESQLFFASYFSGLLKMENDIPTTLFTANNSGLEGGLGSCRINSTAFDKSGNLWLTNSRIKNGLKVLKTNGQWQSYNMETILTDFASNDFCKIAIDKNGTKWMASYKNGVVAFNENTNVFKKITEGSDSGNLPSIDVRAIAIDNRNQVWIGTNKGLRVLSSTGSYNNDGQMKANPIIILEDGLAQELLYEQFITDIAVNGSNQKWIGTADSGVFLFSSNGQETLYHFTKDNSPLPSNVVNDIDINPVSGEVFICTNKGMVSFKGTSTKPADNLNAAYVYPNPVRPEFDGTVKISGLIARANVKITDIEGNLVYETTSEGGTIEWDTTAFGKYKVASGVYMIFIAAEDASETTVKKVMIIR